MTVEEKGDNLSAVIGGLDPLIPPWKGVADVRDLDAFFHRIRTVFTLC